MAQRSLQKAFLEWLSLRAAKSKARLRKESGEEAPRKSPFRLTVSPLDFALVLQREPAGRLSVAPVWELA